MKPRRAWTRLFAISLLLAACDHKGLGGKVTDAGSSVAPSADGGDARILVPPTSCQADKAMCKESSFPVCVDTQRNPRHCGGCNQACTLGIACVGGRCQQTRCTASVVFRAHPEFQAAPNNGVVVYTAAIDINHDGRPDLVGYQKGKESTELVITYGNVAGTFAPPTRISLAGKFSGLALSDLDKDGYDEVIVFNETANTFEYWFFQGDGTVRREVGPRWTESDLDILSIGDLNGDGYPDAVSQEASNVGLHVSLSRGPTEVVPGGSLALQSGSPQSAQVADYDGDGVLDIQYGSTGVGIFYNQRDEGGYRQVIVRDWDAFSSEPLQDKRSFIFGRIDADRRLDALVIEGQSLSFLLSQPDDSFLNAGTMELPDLPFSAFAFTDLDGDGLPDVLSLTKTGALMRVSRMTDGSITADLWRGFEGKNPYVLFRMLPGDFTGDGRTDLVLLSAGGAAVLLENTCAP